MHPPRHETLRQFAEIRPGRPAGVSINGAAVGDDATVLLVEYRGPNHFE